MREKRVFLAFNELTIFACQSGYSLFLILSKASFRCLMT
ncbi:hypothetical protein MTYM_00694 [Methylococcales bacterium]|nr:hypothetical protein MTYM_00694 [Methylococcales bacterium]